MGCVEALASLPRAFLEHYLHCALELPARRHSRWSLLHVLLDATRAHAADEERAAFMRRPLALPLPVRPTPSKRAALAVGASAATASKQQQQQQPDDSVDRFFAESRAAAVRALCTVARAVGIGALLGAHSEAEATLCVVFDHLFLAISDYTRTNRGDVGRLCALDSMST